MVSKKDLIEYIRENYNVDYWDNWKLHYGKLFAALEWVTPQGDVELAIFNIDDEPLDEDNYEQDQLVDEGVRAVLAQLGIPIGR